MPGQGDSGGAISVVAEAAALEDGVALCRFGGGSSPGQSSSPMSMSESPGASTGCCCERTSWNCATPVLLMLPSAPLACVRFSRRTHP
eukprot:2614309-Pyramimonas_sp.AAC.1